MYDAELWQRLGDVSTAGGGVRRAVVGYKAEGRVEECFDEVFCRTRLSVNGPRRGRGNLEGTRIKYKPHTWRREVGCGVKQAKVVTASATLKFINKLAPARLRNVNDDEGSEVKNANLTRHNQLEKLTTTTLERTRASIPPSYSGSLLLHPKCPSTPG